MILKLEAEQFKIPPVRIVKRGEMKWLVKSVKTIPKINSKAGRAAPWRMAAKEPRSIRNQSRAVA